MDQEILINVMASVSAGIAVFCISCLIIDAMQDINMEKVDKDETVIALPPSFKILLHFTGNVTPLTKSGFLASMSAKAQSRLLMAGYDSSTISGEEFIGIRIILFIFGVLIAAICFVIVAPLIGLVIFTMLMLYPMLWLTLAIKKRHLEIQKALPNVLDLLTLSVEAGKDFLTAMRDILGRRRRDALSEELGRTFNEIQIGKQRRIALKDLSLRVKQPDLTSVMNSIIQADELGVSIGQILKIQGDQLRMKRFQRAEKLANEAPVKILLPVTIFIFPPVIVILMGPVIMQALSAITK